MNESENQNVWMAGLEGVLIFKSREGLNSPLSAPPRAAEHKDMQAET